jgi:PadR family transcriptional regulator, regulatory protein PadR
MLGSPGDRSLWGAELQFRPLRRRTTGARRPATRCVENSMKFSIRSQAAPLGTFEEQVLLAVFRTGSEAYGMNVRRELEQVTGRAVTIGSVYVTLDRLESKGLVDSARAARGEAPSRRVFALTPAGALALADTRSMRERLWAGVELRALLRNA